MKPAAGDEVIEVDIASDDADLLVVTENGWGKRTRVSDYPVKGRGTMGVKTVQLVEAKGRLAGARIVREGYQVMLISDGGTVIRMAVDGIKRSGRATQGVIVMRLREGEQVSSLAPVIGSDDDDPDAAEPAPTEELEDVSRMSRTLRRSVGQRDDDHDADDDGGEHDQALDDRLDRRPATSRRRGPARRPAGRRAAAGREHREDEHRRRRRPRRACAPCGGFFAGGSRASRGTRSGSGRRSSSCSSRRSRAASAG